MSNINKHPVRRTAAGVLAGTLALTGGALAAGISPASAATGFSLDRIAGNDRYATSGAITAAFDAAAPVTNVILASGESGRSADALGASFLAGVRGAPVLLTPTAALSASTTSALNALKTGGATSVTIIGGTTAVSANVQAQVVALGFTVTRLGGVDRFATDEAVVAAGEGASASNVGILASGLSTVDALAAGPLAYKGKHPVFLTRAAAVPASTIAAMKANGVTSLYIIGGTTVITPAVEAQLAAEGITVVARLGGQTRSATSVAVANAIIGATFGFTDTTFNLASGANDGVDALSGAALSGLQSRALLITDTATSAGAVTAFAAARSATLNAAGNIFGGTAALSAAVEAEIEAAGVGTATQFETLAVTPTAAQSLVLASPEDGSAAANADNRTFTVTGLNDALRYRITLVNGASIQGTATNRTFLSSVITPASGTTPATFGVDIGADNANITSVNGGTPLNGGAALDAAARTATASPVNGNLTFVIDGTDPGTVVPAIYVDGGQGGTATTGGASIRLETSATAAGQFAPASESYGLGGATTYTNPAAASQVVGATAITSINKAANQFDAANQTFTYDANDTFTVGSGAGGAAPFVASSLDEFEAALSAGDSFTANYSASPAGSSSFQLTDANPPAPTAVSSEKGSPSNSNDITTTVTFTANTNADSVVIQRATVASGTDEAADGTVGTFATIATVTPTAAQITAGSLTYLDDNVAVGVYRYRAALVNDSDQSAFTADPNNESSTAPAADTGAPLAIDTINSTNAGLASELGVGDVVKVSFDEVIGAPVVGDLFRLRDTDATASVGDVINGTNATFTLNGAAETVNGVSRAAGTVLTVTLTGAPTVVIAGTAAGIQVPADIIDQAGTADVAGNAFVPGTGGQDVRIDSVGTDTQNNSADTVVPTATISQPGVAGATATVQFSEAVTGVTSSDFVITDLDGTGAAPTVTVAAVDADTYTLTFAGEALAAGDTVTLPANSAVDTAGNGNTAVARVVA